MDLIQKGHLEIPVQGMDCADCASHVRKAISGLPGINSVEVYLASEKAVIDLEPGKVAYQNIARAVEKAGYSIPDQGNQISPNEAARGYSRAVFVLLAVILGLVLFTVVVGEWLGLFERLAEQIPWPIWAALVAAIGYPVFHNVILAVLQRHIIAHTLMSVGVLAAMVAGEWMTAIIVAVFMRVGDYIESYTTERARQSVKGLIEMAPRKAFVERGSQEIEIPVNQVGVGETVVLRPGDKIPVDGQVLSGYASVDQAPITGEPMPIEAGPGSTVYAAALVQSGSLRVRAWHVAGDTTFSRVVRMVEEAESQKSEIQRYADRFSGYFLPVVAAIAILTFLIRRDPMATVAVLVVACSCAFALATPIAMLASIGAGARRGLMIKGGKYIELLDEAKVLLIDKTGTLTLGKPEIADIKLSAFGHTMKESEEYARLEILRLTASAERFSEHPLAKALKNKANQNNLMLEEPSEFRSFTGIGVSAVVNGRLVEVGRREMFEGKQIDPQQIFPGLEIDNSNNTFIYTSIDGQMAAVFTASDVMRSEVPAAIDRMYELGIEEIEILTGDHHQAAANLVSQIEAETNNSISLKYRANLLPEDKINIVKSYQTGEYRVVMVGDGVNDAPALAQADVGIAMGAAGSDIALEAAHIALLASDWSLVPEVFLIANKTMRVVRMNILFTGLYNLVGLTLAALGILPPVLAAAAQSLPDLGIMANSSRLLRQGNKSHKKSVLNNF